MKLKLILICAILFFICGRTFATHAEGGRIEVKAINTNTFEIRIYYYTKTSSAQANRPTLDSVYVGDGSGPIVFPKIAYVDLPNDIRYNIYSNIHTYNNTGRYKIYFTDPNRSSNIVNIPHSVQVPFHVETEIVIDSSQCLYNSPALISIPIFLFPSNKDLIMSRAATDANWDSLTYSLDTCMGAGGGNIGGYTIPDSVTIEPLTGEFKWKTDPMMQQGGHYSFAIRIDKWRNGNNLGFVMEDFLIEIDSMNTLFDFNYSIYPSNLTSHIFPGDTLILPVEFFDSSTTPSMSFRSELQSQAFFSANANFHSLTGQLFWAPEITDARKTPYHLTFRSYPGEMDLTYEVYVDGSVSDSCHQLVSVNDFQFENDIVVYPNPVSNSLYINNVKENSIHRLLMYDFTGRIVYNEKLSNQIDVSDFSGGIYLLQIENGKSSVYKKIIISR